MPDARVQGASGAGDQAGGPRYYAEATMTYKVYSGPPGATVLRAVEPNRALYQEFGMLDEALDWARHLDERGRVPLLIEDERGMRLTRPEIEAAIHGEGDYTSARRARAH
jgi:hypothetical protein